MADYYEDCLEKARASFVQTPCFELWHGAEQRLYHGPTLADLIQVVERESPSDLVFFLLFLEEEASTAQATFLKKSTETIRFLSVDTPDNERFIALFALFFSLAE